MKKWMGVVLISISLSAASAQAKILTETVAYTHDNVPLQGYLVRDDAYKGRRPGVVVVHEWWGLTDFIRKRAQALAALGYVAFALDMYGADKTTQHPDQAGEWMKQITANVSFWQSRATAGLDVLKRDPHVDPGRLAAVGYCFGGATVQQLAYAGADLRGIVSFHGGLVPPPENAAGRVKAKFLICHGAADPFTPEQDFQKYLAGMKGSGLDWTMAVFSGARHAFTNPDAGKFKMDALQYNFEADHRSWAYMKLFLQEVFSSPGK